MTKFLVRFFLDLHFIFKIRYKQSKKGTVWKADGTKLLGTIHKRRIHRGGGRGVMKSKKWTDIVYGWPLYKLSTYIWLIHIFWLYRLSRNFVRAWVIHVRSNWICKNKYVVVISLSWNFPSWAIKLKVPSRGGAFQFSSWNLAGFFLCIAFLFSSNFFFLLLPISEEENQSF